MKSLRRRAAPLAMLILVAFFDATIRPAIVRAQQGGEPSRLVPATSGPSRPEGSYGQAGLDALSQHFQDTGAAPAEGAEEIPGLADVPRALAALPTGGSVVTPQATALPSGAATSLGMGESFTTQLSTGTAAFGIPLALPSARGAAQPQLNLSYNSAGGFGLAGVGWSIGASAISRQTDRGLPSYDDRDDWHAEQDRFVFGGMELVPICLVGPGGDCGGALTGEAMPAWATGWQYFRARVESGFLRFFWSDDHLTWRVQTKDGIAMELGVPLDGTGYQGALTRNPDEPAEVFAWHLVRQYDSQGGANAAAGPQPVNTVVYRYLSDGGEAYLSDIFDTPPAGSPHTTNLALFAHHTALSYESRADVVVSYRTGWPIEHALRLSHVDVTGKPFDGATSEPRELVRRYHLSYDSEAHTSLLTSVQLEGRCEDPVAEHPDQSLGTTSCPRLPPMTMEYQRVSSAAEPLLDAQGQAFEPFAEQIEELSGSPPHSLDEAQTELMDVNADGLEDVVVTAPGIYDGEHAVFYGGLDDDGFVGFSSPVSLPVIPAGDVDASVLSFANANVSALDLDGDGVANLVHMPRAKTYSVFRPERVDDTPWPGRARWRGRAVSTASEQDLKIDFTGDTADIRVLDVNGDGLVDVVHTSPTEVQTFFALGRYPGGDDQFGQAEWTSENSAELSNAPVTACAPWSAQPVRFSDPDTFVADMNGDGLPDIVRMRSGQVVYWPGRGNGFWGTGERSDCPGGEFAEDRHIVMFNAPRFGSVQPGTLLVNDVNGDGLSDVVEVRNQGVDIYLNDNGTGWTDRHLMDETPFRPSASNYVRLTDVDGSGSPDILWGAAHEYRYIDLTGGVTPYLLTASHNGLGKTLELEYESSAELMRKAAVDGQPWDSWAPTLSPVLVRSTARDNLELIGRQAGAYVNEYSYRDPVYEGRQREFRGFREAVVRTLGDDDSPTTLQRTVFQLGECPDDQPGSPGDVCSPAERWQDNWREALKGLVALTETYDEQGRYLSTEHSTYRLEQLYTARDGRRVTAPMPVRKDAWLYDVASFDHAETETSLPEVEVALVGVARTESRLVTKRASAGAVLTRSQTVYDSFGNTTTSVREGCVDGCPAGVDEIITAHSELDRPTGDESGWLWRETHSYIEGNQHVGRRSETSSFYDASGNMTEVRGVLSGTLPLDRFHESGLAVAPAPPGASGGAGAPVEVVLESTDYDDFGQSISVHGPNGRCAEVERDTQYEQLPVLARKFVGPQVGDCGQTELENHVTYHRNRGTLLVTDSFDATGQPSHFEYDGFGRLTSSRFANPDAPGTLAAQASFVATYDLPTDASSRPYSVVHTRVQDGPSPNTASYADAYQFVDGLGRTLVVLRQADPASGDEGQWLASGATLNNAKGAAALSCDPYFYDGDPLSFPLALSSRAAVPSACTFQEFDAFGRPLRSYRRSGVQDSEVFHRALGVDIWDAADMQAGAHQGTYASTIADGHGRTVVRTARIHVNGAIEQRHTINRYLPTGEVEQVIQRRQGSPDVVRWLRYDTFGRVVLNVEPNTSVGFTPNVAADPSTLKAWRYAYDDAGDLVGISDARGCGANYHFDSAGRLIAEDRSPCRAHQAPYSAPNLATGNGTEAFYRYDAADPDTGSIVDGAGVPFEIDTSLLLGHVVSTSGLGSKGVFRYDALGRGTGIALRIQRPGSAASTLSARYAPRWYTQEQSLDALGRIASATTGMTVPELLGDEGESAISFEYSKRGSLIGVDSSYGRLAGGPTAATHALTYDANGLPRSVTLGDLGRTQRDFVYDVDLRIEDVLSYRANIPAWTMPPAGSSYTPPEPGEDPTRQLLLEDLHYDYDIVGNIVGLEDNRAPEDWPASAKPTSRTFSYDDLYRLTQVTYQRAGGSDPWRSPFQAELSDATRPQPSPQGSFANRVVQQGYSYDSLGNIAQSTDDQSGFWDRSTGVRTHGTAAAGPHQLRSASNRSLAPGSPAKGDLDVAYDAAGNLTDLIVRRDGACLPAGTSCWQRFHYDFDEVGELVRARRWDLRQSPVNERNANGQLAQSAPSRSPNADLQYGYDSGGGRVLKTSVNEAGVQKHTVYVSASLELRSADWDATAGDYVLSAQTASLRLATGPVSARVLHSDQDLPSLTSGHQHVFLEFADHLGSTSFVIDHATGELVEYLSYQAYGTTDGDYRPGRWASFREAYQFSGKEQDIEVGLAYFGARYYVPQLGVWLTPDPATIHDLESDTNPYAYVVGSPVMGVDPDGRNPLISGLISLAVYVAVAIVTNQPITFRGAVASFAAGMVGDVVGTAIATATSSAIAGGVVGNVAGYVTGSAVSGRELTAAGLGSSAISGFVSGGVGAGSDLGDTLVRTAVSTAASFVITSSITGNASLSDFGMALSSSLASSVASYEVNQPHFSEDGVSKKEVMRAQLKGKALKKAQADREERALGVQALKDPYVRAEIARSWKDSQAGTPKAHEEGGFYGLELNGPRAGKFGFRRFHRGSSDKIGLPARPDGNYEGLMVLGSWHTHPMSVKTHWQVPSVEDVDVVPHQWFAGDSFVIGHKSIWVLRRQDGKWWLLGSREQLLAPDAPASESKAAP